MASRRFALGLLTIAAIVAAVVVAVWGGGPSASGTTTSASAAGESGGSGEAKQDRSSSKDGSSGADDGSSGKKHPPLKLPGGKPEEGFKPEQRRHIPTADIKLKIDGKTGIGTIPMPVNATCKGKDRSPALEWTNVPSGTEELVLFAMNLQPVNGELYFDWAVAGIDPSVTELEEGEVPDGAVIGRNSAGQTEYSVCPQNPEGETIIFALYAVPKHLGAEAGFSPLPLRKQASAVAPSVGLLGLGVEAR